MNGVIFDAGMHNYVYPTARGNVFKTGFDKTIGCYIVIKHNKLLYTVYGHLRQVPPLKKGSVVDTDTLIGYAAKTGLTTRVGSLFYGVIYENRSINPLKLLDKDMLEYIRLVRHNETTNYYDQYFPKHLKNLVVNKEDLISKVWGPDGGGPGLYLYFLDNGVYEVNGGHGSYISGSYEIRDNKVILTTDSKENENDFLYDRFKGEVILDYYFDKNGLVNSVKLGAGKYLNFYDPDSMAFRTEPKLFNGIEVYSIGKRLAIVISDTHVYSKPDAESEHYLFDFYWMDSKEVIRIGHEVVVYAKTAGDEEKVWY